MEKLIYIALFAISTTLVTSINFECDFHYFQLGPILGERYSCHGSPGGDLNDPYVRSITGVHQSGLDNSDVIGFYLYHDTHVPFLPRRLPDFFPNMLGLAMLNSTLGRLYSDDLVGYDNLVAFSLRESHVEEIPIGFFEHAPNLLGMNWIDNRIRLVGQNILAPLTSLTSANFQRNYCVDFAANIDTLPQLQNMLNTNCTYLSGSD